MSKLLTDNEGQITLELARKAITEYLNSKKVIEPDGLSLIFDENRGVFVTLNNRIGAHKELRGCIGRPYPVMPLGEAIIISAINAATEDPRFNPVTIEELKNISIEVTILTIPYRLEVEPEKLPGEIIVGKHGLIVQKGPYAGLLLPQVAVEHGFDAGRFLDQTCLKAGLYPDAWLESDTEVYAFEGQIFHEE
ncbi:MAG: TIGR00296 family protein [Nitrospirae bacterium]|nr:TIGR00296 family protein [Nitrospirota bacterium]